MKETSTTDPNVRRARQLSSLRQQKRTLEMLIADTELNTVLRTTCKQRLIEVQQRIDSLEWQAAYA